MVWSLQELERFRTQLAAHPVGQACLGASEEKTNNETNIDNQQQQKLPGCFWIFRNHQLQFQTFTPNCH
eukprot:2773685-Amphidinium_carterae.1